MCEILDDQDGRPIREYSRSSLLPCPHCIVDLIYIGHGDYAEDYECYCQTVTELQAPDWEIAT